MHAIQLTKPTSLQAIDLPEPPTPAPGEAAIRIHRIGVCGTDLHAFAGNQPFFTYPRILGHELGAEVVAVGAGVDNVQVGDRCSVEPYLNCQKCIACRRGKPNCCVKLQVLGVHIDGGMRERIVVPARKLHPSRVLSFEQLALVETLGIGAHAVARARLEKDEETLVIGAGPIGLAVAQFAVEAGARVTVLDINGDRLRFVQRWLGIPHIVNGSETDAAAEMMRITSGDMPTAVFDATGSPASMGGAFRFPANGGRLVFVGLFQGEISFNDPDFHRRELTILATRNAHTDDFRHIIRLIEERRIDVGPWITHRAAFRDVVANFPSWTRPETGVIKAMIEV